jgi:hypothetical protein
MKAKTIPSSWLRHEGRRFDCGPYTSGAQEARIRLRQLEFKKQPLLSLTRGGGKDGIFHAGRESRWWVDSEEYGVRFLSSSSVLRADLSSLPFLHRSQIDANPRFTIGRGWTLITRSGTIGRMVYARPDMDGIACSEHVMRVVPDEQKVPPGYIYAFLSSKFGVPLVVSGTYGSIIQSIEPQHIAELPVPRLGELEKRVSSLMEESATLIARYQALVNEATDCLFASVGLIDVTPADWHSSGSDIGFSVSFPRWDSLRALNFNPRFESLKARIQRGPWKKLGDICEPGTLTRGGRFKRIDADPEYSLRLVGQKHLFWLQPEGRWIARFALGSDVTVEPGTVLIAAQGTLGENELYCRAEFAWGPGVELAYSEHILRARADEDIMPRGCLFAFLRSETAFRMLRSISVGSKLQDHHHIFRAEIPVPYPPKEVQHQVHDLVVEAYERRHRGVALENEARTLVERAIEEAG